MLLLRVKQEIMVGGLSATSRHLAQRVKTTREKRRPAQQRPSPQGESKA
jgi:hypothetical protein